MNRKRNPHSVEDSGWWEPFQFICKFSCTEDFNQYPEVSDHINQKKGHSKRRLELFKEEEEIDIAPFGNSTLRQQEMGAITSMPQCLPSQRKQRSKKLHGRSQKGVQPQLPVYKIRGDITPPPKSPSRISPAPLSFQLGSKDFNNETKESDFGDRKFQNQDECPEIFILAEFGDVEAGKEHWKKTLVWRAEMGADDALQTPHPKFDICKQFYPHYFYSRDLEGNIVYFEKIGGIDVKGFKRNGITSDDLLWHFMYNMEYLWTVISPSYDDRMTMVLDIKHFRIQDLVGETKNFIKDLVSMASYHYPQRAKRIFILNTPPWFMVVYKLIKPFIHELTRKRITMLGSDYHGALRNVIAPEDIPEEYGGTGPELSKSIFETQYRQHVVNVLALHSQNIHEAS